MFFEYAQVSLYWIDTELIEWTSWMGYPHKSLNTKTTLQRSKDLENDGVSKTRFEGEIKECHLQASIDDEHNYLEEVLR